MAKEKAPKKTTAKQRKNKGHENIKKHQWKPGQSGNPSGRPKGMTLTKLLRQRMDEGFLDKLAEMVLEKASEGDIKAFQEIFDRLDPKTAKHEVKTETERSREEMEAELAALLAKREAGGSDS